jgi:crotonobetainyl-CoA:carnitine CoA-transferase CaiB-like acyl-CoA transferase
VACADAASLPLAGVRVVELTHMVMGPTCGMILADLGAEVIKVEPPEGDHTRRLPASGAGFFATFNRNKKDLAVDLRHPRGREIVLRLVAGADVFSENFKAGTVEALGLGREALGRINPRLVYVSHKGFLPGPYEHRTALDEVVQRMGGLAYMTGPEGRPMRAGASVNDVMGGLFGALGVLAALRQRDRSGHGHGVDCSLFENCVLLVAQHMMQFAVTGQPAAPMPGRLSALAIYDDFAVAGGERIFLAVATDTQWGLFCDEFGFADLKADPRLASNGRRVQAREWLLPTLRQRLAPLPAEEVAARFERNGLPFARVARPHDLFHDPHLVAGGGLAPVTVPADASIASRPVATHTPLLPLMIDGRRLPLRSGPPPIGADTDDLLRELGYAEGEVAALRAQGVVGSTAAHGTAAQAGREG